MAYSGVLDDIRKAVAMQRPDRLPVFLCSEEADVRLCNSRYDFYNSDAKEMARVQIEAVKRFDYDWAWLQVDDCIEFEPLGVGVKGSGNILPATCEYLSATPASLETLKKHGYSVQGRMQVLLDAIKTIKDKFGDTICVTGRVAAPFSSVTLAFGMTETLMLLYDQPEFVQDALHFFEDYQMQFGIDQIKAGADALWLGDCNASGHLISPRDYKTFAMEPARHVCQACKEAGGFVICHASEEKPEMVDLQSQVGFSILSIGPGLRLDQARQAAKGRVCLSGNVNPILVLERGTPQMVREAVEWTVRNISLHGGHVMNSGEMVPRDTPEENIRTFVETARSAWQKANSTAADN